MVQNDGEEVMKGNELESIEGALKAIQRDVERLPAQILAKSKPKTDGKTLAPALDLADSRDATKLGTFRLPFKITRQYSLRRVKVKAETLKALEVSSRSSQENTADPASFLLAILAPPVSRLQHLGQRIRALPPCDAQKHQNPLLQVCTLMQGSLADLKIESKAQSENGGIDGNLHWSEFEMVDLMIDALLKKVSAEVSAVNQHCKPPPPPTPTPTRKAETVLPSIASVAQLGYVAPGTIVIGAPDSPRNIPFVLHSTDVLSPKRSITPTRAIPVHQQKQRQPYSSFVSSSQQTAALMDIFRLGSFQSSMLFSPSPIAVRRIGK